MNFSGRIPGRPWPLEIPEGWPGQALIALLALGLGAGAGLAVVALPNPLLGFGALAGLLAGGLMLARPLFTIGAAAVICCLLPFGIIPVRAGFLTFTLLEASLLILFMVWLLRLATHQSGLVTGPFDWAILLFVGLSLFSYILGWQTSSSSDILHSYAKLVLAILQFFAVINIVRTQSALDNILRTLLVAGTMAGYLGAGLTALPRELQSGLLIRLSALGYPTERVLRFVEDDEATKPQRATGTSVDPNSFGGMLVLIVALLVTQLVSARPLLPRRLLILMMPGPALALFLTYGRGAQLGALAVVAFVATVKYRRLWLYALPFLAAGAVWLPSSFLGQRLAQGFALEDPATIMRLNEYQNALDIIARYPWFGVGFGGSPSIDLTVGVSMIYLTIAERMGLVGLAVFGLVLILFFNYTLRNLGRMKDERRQANLLGLAGGVIGALAVGCLDHYFFNGEFSHMAALFWLFMGLAVVQVRLGLAEDQGNKN